MKKNPYFFLFPLFLLLFTSAVDGWCRESVAVESLQGALPQEKVSGTPFGLTVTERDQLIAKAGTVFTEGGDYQGISLPYLISTPKPISYPRWALRQGWQGKLVIALEIFTDGGVGRMKVMKSSGYPLLDRTAEEAIGHWRFHPAIKNGQPVHTCIQIPVAFELTQE